MSSFCIHILNMRVGFQDIGTRYLELKIAFCKTPLALRKFCHTFSLPEGLQTFWGPDHVKKNFNFLIFETFWGPFTSAAYYTLGADIITSLQWSLSQKIPRALPFYSSKKWFYQVCPFFEVFHLNLPECQLVKTLLKSREMHRVPSVVPRRR